MRHLLSPLDLSVEETDQLLSLASDIEKNRSKYAHVCDGKKLATLFFEPSTRTRLSFESAMLSLGGSVLGVSSADSSSAAKGESVSDTIRVISCYADICAMRHPKEGSAYVAASKSSIPVINAGDGGHQHPTQTLTDLLTIKSLKGRLGDMTVGLCGDLKFGRTVHSLIHALVRYPGIRFVLISPPELKVPDYIKENVLDANHIPYRETTCVICLATMLHTIATGNMTPSFRVLEDGTIRPLYLYTVDADEFVVNKLLDRGSLSATTMVTNVQDFITIVARGLGIMD